MNPIAQQGSRHIGWEDLRLRIQNGIPFVHRIPSIDGLAPDVDIWVSEFGKELALRVHCYGVVKPKESPLEEIKIAMVHTLEGVMLEVRTSTLSLYQEMYSFFVSVADKIQLNGVLPIAAVEETLEGWRELLRTRTSLSEEVQLGLRGELYFLRILIEKLGDEALSAWVGPQRQPHDFRFGKKEFEVKATSGPRHAHIINGFAQLQPSLEHDLFVFSLRFAPSGLNFGTTLSEDIHLTRDLLSNDVRIKLDIILREYFSYRPEHSPSYPKRLQLVNSPLVIPVDEQCPKLNDELLSGVPHRERIKDIRYFADFEGLGFREGMPSYSRLFEM